MNRKTRHLALAVSIALGTTVAGLQAQTVVITEDLQVPDIVNQPEYDLIVCADSGASGATGTFGKCASDALPMGPTGATGATGPMGPTGPAGAGGTGAGYTPCPAGATFALQGDSNGKKLKDDDDRYLYLVGSGDPKNNEDDNARTVYCGGTLEYFQVLLSEDPGNSSQSDGYTFTVMSPTGSTTAMGCTVTADSDSCSTSGSVVLTACDTVNVWADPVNSPASEPEVDQINSTFTLDGSVCTEPPIR